jgi:hypothetical protein
MERKMKRKRERDRERSTNSHAVTYTGAADDCTHAHTRAQSHQSQRPTVKHTHNFERAGKQRHVFKTVGRELM